MKPVYPRHVFFKQSDFILPNQESAVMYLFVKVSILSQNCSDSVVFVVRFQNCSDSWYFLLDFRTVPTVWYFLSDFRTVPTLWYFC